MQSIIHVEKFYQDHLWVTHTYGIDNASVDAWEAVVQDYIAFIGRPERYMVFNMSAIPNPGVTLYMNKRVTALSQNNRDAKGRIGVVLNLNPMLRYVFEPFIRFASSQFQPELKVHLFAHQDEALTWVQEALPLEIREAGHQTSVK